MASIAAPLLVLLRRASAIDATLQRVLSAAPPAAACGGGEEEEGGEVYRADLREASSELCGRALMEQVSHAFTTRLRRRPSCAEGCATSRRSGTRHTSAA